MSNLGFIGLGIMGRPMAGHLIAGHKLFLHGHGTSPKELLDKGAAARTLAT
jgi:2-hydroxy-3-oxopropionate reductase